MKAMRKVEMLEVIESVREQNAHRVIARLTCGHFVESWGGQNIGAIRRCRECESIPSTVASEPPGTPSLGEQGTFAPAPREEWKGRVVIRFDGPPGPASGRFVEVEKDGRSISYGTWHPDGNDWLLVLPKSEPAEEEGT